MADKRIDAHTNTTTVADVDEFIVDSGSNGTRNITYSNLKDQLLGTTSIATIGNSVTEAIYNVHMDQAVPKIDTTTGVMYLEGGSAFEGNIDSTPTAGSNNAVASGGTKTYVDNAVSNKAKTLLIRNTSFSLDSNLAVGETANVIVQDSSMCIAFADDSNSLSGTVARLADAVYAWHLATYNYKFIYVRTNSSFTVSRRFYAAGTSF